jgi:hypothetical protein
MMVSAVLRVGRGSVVVVWVFMWLFF